MNIKSDTAILFLYEGDTEGGFYDRLFELLNVGGNVQIRKKCLHGVYNLNKNVANAIYNYLESKNNKHIKHLTIFVAYDRDENRTIPGRLNKSEITKKLDDNRLKEIHEIIATQMLESWFFIDIEGIYKFLKTQKSKRNPSRYKQHESFRDVDLQRLFKDHGKKYCKGERTENFIENLDVLKIYAQCKDLNNGMNLMLQLAGIAIDKRKK